MFSRLTRSIAQVAVKRVTFVRAPVARAFSAHAAPAAGDVVVPELVDTLEWVLDSPPNVHQFEEPPVVVEIEHLKNLKYEDVN